MITRRILKYKVTPFGATEVKSKSEPRWLAVGAQGPDVVVWAEVEEGTGYITVLNGEMTGRNAPPLAHYVGTAQQADGIVVHVYRSKSWKDDEA